jgi:hypothetical protein
MSHAGSIRMRAPSIDERILRTAAQGAAVPPHTKRSVVAHPIPFRGGNAHVHEHHLSTTEDHIDPDDVDELDLAARRWSMLLYVCLGLMTVGLIFMIARS